MSDNLSNVDEIFCAAIELSSPGERGEYVERACGGNAELRHRVDALLAAHFGAGDFLERSPATALLPDHEIIQEGPGTLIGPYKLLEQIGEGGMGVVYMADQQAPVRRRVALKIIKAGMDTRQVIARFEAERQALALMDHSNIARVLDAGATESGRPYFVMELVRGIPITEYCDQNNLPVHERLELFVQVCHAVQHAHQKGIIHRDLKPTNVLVTLNDGRAVPKVIDFGVAKATGQQLTEKTLFTAFAQMVGTPLYMSPEQAEMTSVDIDTRSDIYSLGVLLYELLTGTTPFDQERMRAAAFDEIRRIIREEEPPKPSTRISTLGESRTATAAHRQVDAHRLGRLMEGDLDWIVMKALEKDRTRRYDTAGDFAADVLRHLSDQPVEACPPSAGYRFRKFTRRNRVALITVLLVSGALLLGTLVSTWQAIRATRAAQLTEIARAAEAEQRTEAERQRFQAEANEKRAHTEAAKSQQVAQFLTDMLAAAGPGVARGRDATLLREILDKTALRVDKDLKDQPEVQGDLWFTLGTTFGQMGDYGRAVPLLQHAVDSFRVAPGGDNKRLALALASLGRCQSFTGKVADGMSNARLGLDIARRCGDPETLAICLISMGKACNFYGLGAAEAVPYFREAVDIYRKLGNNPVALADCLPSIAGSDSEAIPLIREALALHRQHLGPDHPKVASNLDSLGQALLAHGDYEEAEHVLRETVALYRKIHDPSYPYHRSTRRTLVAAIVMQKKWDEAETVARDAHDPTTSDGVDWDLLGRINAYRGRWPVAAEQLARAIELNPKNDRYQLAVALAETKQDESYRQLRRYFFDNYSTESPDGARALAFLLRPVDGEELANLEQLVESSYYTKMGPLVASRGRLDKALAAYRLGRYQVALDAASPALVDEARLPNQAQAWFIQALAGARMQKIELARSALAEGDKLLGKPDRNIQGDFLWDSFDWRIAEFLRAEAAELLGISEPAKSTDAAP